MGQGAGETAVPPWCPTHHSLKLGLLGIWLMARPCSQELPAVKLSCLEAGGPREPDLHCRAQQRDTEMGQGRVGRARGRDDKGRGKEQSVLNSVAFK